MATIEFRDYIIEESVYHTNPKFREPTSEGELIIEHDLEAEIGIDGNEKGYVKINIVLGDFSDNERIENIPFMLKVTIRGVFNYSDEISGEQLKTLLGSNALAILYPYLRSYVTFITSQSNQFPAYILPVVNFVDMVENTGRVKFVGFSVKEDSVN